MIAGVLCETARGERRVALTPDDAARLAAADIDVVVESAAGQGAGFADGEYRAAGAQVVADRAEVFVGADLVAWVKPPAFALETAPLRAGTVLLGFQDPLHRAGEIAELRDRGVRSVAFEDVVREDGAAEIDALSAMSRIAGAVAYEEGRRMLPARRRARQVRALVLGCGVAGLAAVGAAAGLGDVAAVAVGNRLAQRAAALDAGAGRFVLNPDADRGAIADLVAAESPDLIVCTAVHRGAHAPLLLDAAVLDRLTPGAVVVDLVAKAGGNCAGVRPDAAVRRNGVVITHRSNYPSDRPRAASVAFGAATAAMIERIAAAGPV